MGHFIQRMNHLREGSSNGRLLQGKTRPRDVSFRDASCEKMLGYTSVGDTLSWHENVKDAKLWIPIRYSKDNPRAVLGRSYFYFLLEGMLAFLDKLTEYIWVKIKQGKCICPLSCSWSCVHCHFATLCVPGVYLIDILTVVYYIYTHIHSYISAPKLSPVHPPAPIS